MVFFSIALPAHSGPWPLIQFRNHLLQTVGFLGRVISPSRGLYLNTGQHKHRINAYTHQTYMPWVDFEPMIPASEQAKTVHALDRAATVTGRIRYYSFEYSFRIPYFHFNLLNWNYIIRIFIFTSFKSSLLFSLYHVAPVVGQHCYLFVPHFFIT
jgi:hypothetical protein